MEHLAILSKKRKLLNRIISGEKTIESRWYISKKPPFKSICVNDVVYFKESGEPVTAKAKVKDVLFYEDLTHKKIKEILSAYSSQLGIDLSYFEEIKNKKFCSLIFLKDIEKITPFKINKKGYGLMSSWMTLNHIENIKAK